MRPLSMGMRPKIWLKRKMWPWLPAFPVSKMAKVFSDLGHFVMHGAWAWRRGTKSCSPCGTLLGSGDFSTKDSGGCRPEPLVASRSDSVGWSGIESGRWWRKARTTSTSTAVVFADWECAWVCLDYFTLKQNNNNCILSQGEDQRV